MSNSLPIINKKLERIKQFVLTEDMEVNESDIKGAVVKFMKFKGIIGNFSNDIHYLTAYLASSYLKKKHGNEVIVNLDKPSGSSGLDVESNDIVAEIKTTIPYQGHQQNDFGSKQKSEIIPDLKGLESSPAKYKYFFVTDSKTERILKSKYMKEYPSVTVVNLLEEN